MKVYLASPRTQQQASAAADMPVLLSYACYSPWQDQYLPSFERLLLDSGAFSELNCGKKVDLVAYIEWAESIAWAENYAGLDDIGGDYNRSFRNYEAGGFPTFHPNSDPPELLDDLIPMAQERNNWLGIGLLPPREGHESIMRHTLDRIPQGIHIHGWACGMYTHLARIDSVDSTNWFRDAMLLRTRGIPLEWLTYGETLEIIVKRVQRQTRITRVDNQLDLIAR